MKQIKEKIITNCIMALFVIMATGLINTTDVYAKTAPMKISSEELVMLKGTHKKLKIINLPQTPVKIKWSTSNKFAATVTKKGKIKALNYGTAKITAKCGKKKFLCKVTIPDTSRTVTLNTTKVTLAENEQYQLVAQSTGVVQYHSGNDAIVVVSSEGLVTAVNPGIVTITAKSATGFARCVVTVNSNDAEIETPEWITDKRITAIRRLTKNNNFVYDNITWAKGKDITFKIAGLDETNIKKCVWSSLDETIVSIPDRDSECKIKATAKTLAVGEAVITAVVTDKSGRETTYRNVVYVTDPIINAKELTLLGPGAGGARQKFVSFDGLHPYSKVEWTNSSDNATLTTYKTKVAVMGVKAGEGVITAKVDGKTYTVNYVVKNPIYNPIKDVLAKGKTLKLNVTGTDGVPISYRSRNTKVAAVDGEGNITGVKAGVTYIDVKIENVIFTYKIDVAAKGIKTIIKRADYIVNHWKYSQKKRMKKGYYDCSALVWKGYKSYKKYQKKLGSAKRALPAASLFDYLHKKNKIVYFGYTSIDDLQPGDLIFYGDYDNAVKYSTPGRTLDIYHVSMYAGYGSLIEKNGRNMDYNNIKDIVGVGRVVK